MDRTCETLRPKIVLDMKVGDHRDAACPGRDTAEDVGGQRRMGVENVCALATKQEKI